MPRALFANQMYLPVNILVVGGFKVSEAPFRGSLADMTQLDILRVPSAEQVIRNRRVRS